MYVCVYVSQILHLYLHFCCAHVLCTIFLTFYLQDSRRRELVELQQQLCSNEALLADFQRNLLQREREPEEIRSMGTGGAQVRVCCMLLECVLTISSHVISVQVYSYFFNFLHYYSSAHSSHTFLHAFRLHPHLLQEHWTAFRLYSHR